MFLRGVAPGILAAGLLYLAGCGKAELSDIEYLEQARSARAKGDFGAAIIGYKNALQRNAGNAEARLSLGSAYLELGDGADAEKELRQASRLGVSGSRFMLSLGRALFLQREYQKLLDDVHAPADASNDEKAAVLALRGAAYARLGNMAQARNALNEAIALDPESLPAFIGLAEMESAARNYAAANAYLEKAFAVDHESPEAWLFKGVLAFAQSHFEEAEQAYEHVLSRETSKALTVIGSRALVGEMYSLLAQNKNDQALLKLEILRKSKNKSQMISYLRGLVAYRQGKYPEAQEYLQGIEKAIPDYVPALLLLGATHFAQQHYEQAELYLSRFNEIKPDHLAARKMLAATRLQLGRPTQALAVISSAGGSAQDAELLSMAASALIQMGDYQQGSSYLRKAVAKNPDVSDARIQLASVYIMEGDFDKAIGELESTAGNGDETFRSAALLVSAHMHKKDYAAAQLAAGRLVEKFPRDPRASNLLGSVYYAAGDRGRARSQYQQALQIDARYVPSILNLARLHYESGDVIAARRRFSEALAIDNKNGYAMLGLAIISEKQGDAREAVQWVEKARAGNTKAINPRLLLARYYWRVHDFDKAFELIGELNQLAPHHPDVLAMQADLYMASGNIQGALHACKKRVELDPKSMHAHYQFSQALMRSGDDGRAQLEAWRAVELQPDFVPALSLLAVLEAKAGNYTKARQWMKEIMRRKPDSPAGEVLDGDIFMLQKEYADAVKAYRTAWAKAPTADISIKIHQALKQAGDVAKADSELEQWLEKHPDDAGIKGVLAGSLYQQGKHDMSIAYYREILNKQPENVVALNDLAWILAEKNRAPEAMQLAERAYKLNPESGEVLDTLGWLLVRQGDIAGGLPYLRRAAERHHDHPDIQFHLAYALSKHGDGPAARDLLKKILAENQAFASHKEAIALLGELQSLPAMR